MEGEQGRARTLLTDKKDKLSRQTHPHESCYSLICNISKCVVSK